MSPDAGEHAVGAGLRALADSQHPYPAERFEGRGIVVCAGGARLFACAWVCLSVLRRVLGCTLAVEVWHIGAGELGAVEAALLGELDAVAVDASAFRARHPARVLGGWELKSYALANCRFREVILLDADNVPLRDPEHLFDCEPFRRTGALFWPDVSWLTGESDIWELCGLPPQSVRAWESGQVVLDKARCWAPLQLVRCMNDHSEIFYRHLHGDKDTFTLAWEMLRTPRAMPRRGPRAMSWGLIQHDFDGEPLFQHRNQAKWVLRGENPPLPGFQLHEACVAALADLARRWRGRIEPLPARTSADLEAEAELASARLFVLDRGGSDSSELELLVANRIGDGRCDARQRWFVADGTLVLDGLRGPSARLRLDDDGVWRGRSLEPGGQPLVLVPLACSPQDPLAVVIAALLERVVANEVPADDAVATVVTLGALGDLSPLLVRERARWPENSLAARTIDRARWRLGRRNPSLRANDGGDARRYAPA